MKGKKVSHKPSFKAPLLPISDEIMKVGFLKLKEDHPVFFLHPSSFNSKLFGSLPWHLTKSISKGCVRSKTANFRHFFPDRGKISLKGEKLASLRRKVGVAASHRSNIRSSHPALDFLLSLLSSQFFVN